MFLISGIPGQYVGYYHHLGGDDKAVVNLDKRGSSYHFRSFSYPFRSLQPGVEKRGDPSKAGTGRTWGIFPGMEFVGKRSGGKSERLIMKSQRKKRPSLYLLNSLNV